MFQKVAALPSSEQDEGSVLNHRIVGARRTSSASGNCVLKPTEGARSHRRGHAARRFHAAWLILGLAPIVSLLGCGGESNETSGQHTATIAFTVNRSGFGEIWVMDSDGRNRIQLTEPSQPDVDASGSTSPDWSPDGSFIAFASSGEPSGDERDLDIWVMRADGSERRRLTNDDVHDGTPVWSPDGSRLAFAHTPELGTEDADGVIVVMDANGRGRIEITRHPETPDVIFDSQPAWSPDGSIIAFSRATFTSDGQARTAIYTIEPTGAGEHLLVDDATELSWSPEGSRIVFTSFRDRNGETCFHECSPSGEIYVAKAEGTGLRRLTVSQANDHAPAWASDGQLIAFVSDRSNRAEHENEIYVIAPDGSGLQRLTTNDVWDLEPAWR